MKLIVIGGTIIIITFIFAIFLGKILKKRSKQMETINERITTSKRLIKKKGDINGM